MDETTKLTRQKKGRRQANGEEIGELRTGGSESL